MEYISSFVGWFLQNFTSEDISMVQLIVTLGMAGVISVYIFMVYRLLVRKTFYSLRYNIMIASMVLIITAIIFSVQSSVLLSLGVLGALSIVRFRTAIKDPLDIVFLFWAITAGICVGAHMSEIAIILSALVTILIFFLEDMSLNRNKRILLVEFAQEKTAEQFWMTVKKECKSYVIKKQDEEKGKLVLEVKCKDEYTFFKKITEVKGVSSISLVSHGGENCF